MMIEPDILQGVGVPVFVMSAVRPRRVLAWNLRMVEVTGVPADQAVGQGVDHLFGSVAQGLQSISCDGTSTVFGLGSVVAQVHDDRIVVTLSEDPTHRAFRLVVEDMRAQLRRIHQLSGDARQDVFTAEASLVRIRQIAREGMTRGHRRMSGPVADHQSIALQPLCRTLLQDVAPNLTCHVAQAMVVAKPAIMEYSLRALLIYAAERRKSGIRIVVENSVKDISLHVTFDDPAADKERMANNFRDDTWLGLLALRRDIRTSGAQLAVARSGDAQAKAVVLIVPGTVLLANAGGGQARVSAFE